MRAALRLLFLGCLCAPAAASVVHHELSVTLDPQRGALRVRDRLSLPEGSGKGALEFALHAALRLDAPTTAQVVDEGTNADGVPLRRYRLVPDDNRPTVVELSYHGQIAHPLRAGSARKGGRRDTPGLISAKGVYLGPESLWYPQIEGTAVRFRLTVHAPEGWRAISQGERRANGPERVSQWHTHHPQQGIYLVANRLMVYHREMPWGTALVYLRRDDDRLARRYLEATDDYVRLYSALIGPYPYPKFALVENFWETGFGMPSFTLMGARVIRLPFIVRTSYPHEVLHNWWGNSVYVGQGGNWVEGLTAYLADHLLAERRGEGARHRRDALQSYADFVRRSEAFPLRAFHTRHDAITQAVGYGKGLMVFHMLRRRLGDRRFLQGLQRFYRTHRFRSAGFEDLRAAFEPARDGALAGFFAQWVDRAGAPALAVDQVVVHPQADGAFRIAGRLTQTQSGAPYALRIPVVVQVAGGAQPVVHPVWTDRKRQAFEITAPARPLRLAVDPAFDVFRRLDRQELPPAFSQLFGHQRALFVLPSAASDNQRAAYRRLAARWAAMYPRARVALDREVRRLPRDRAVWVLGWRNRYRNAVAGRLPQVTLGRSRARFQGQTYHRNRHTLALATRTPAPAHQPLAWVASDNLRAVEGLARKLPHYGRSSYVVFRGREPVRLTSGQWPVTKSPLQVELAADAPPLVLPQRPPLTHVLDKEDAPPGAERANGRKAPSEPQR